MNFDSHALPCVPLGIRKLSKRTKKFITENDIAAPPYSSIFGHKIGPRLNYRVLKPTHFSCVRWVRVLTNLQRSNIRRISCPNWLNFIPGHFSNGTMILNKQRKVLSSHLMTRENSREKCTAAAAAAIFRILSTEPCTVISCIHFRLIIIVRLTRWQNSLKYYITMRKYSNITTSMTT